MKVSPGFSPAAVYDLRFTIKLLAGPALLFLFHLTVPAQDSLQLRTFKDSNLFDSPLVFADLKKITNWREGKKRPYLFEQNVRFRPDTAAINDRYKPGAHPALLWNLTYPLTEDQRMAEVEKQRIENQVGRQIANEVIQTILGRKKIPAVKPTF
jgi:hypothetical protein